MRVICQCMELSTIKCEFLYAECCQTFHCTYRLFFIFEVYHRKIFIVLSRAAISGISVLAVLALFCCTCYCVVFLSKQIDDDDDDEEQGLSRQGQGRCLTSWRQPDLYHQHLKHYCDIRIQQVDSNTDCSAYNNISHYYIKLPLSPRGQRQCQELVQLTTEPSTDSK